MKENHGCHFGGKLPMRLVQIAYHLLTLICIGLFLLLPHFFRLSSIEANYCFLLFFIVAIGGFILGMYWKSEILFFMAVFLLFVVVHTSIRGIFWWYGHHYVSHMW